MNRSIITGSESIFCLILLIRGKKVIIDSDLAKLYGVQTKRLNEQVKRNIQRFPEDFMFQLTSEELAEVVANCDHLQNLKFSSTNPRAFTEHGALMISGVLNTTVAIETSIFIVRTFVKLRGLMLSHEQLERKISMLEKRYDKNFLIVFEALKQLMQQENEPRKKIGYKTNNNEAAK